MLSKIFKEAEDIFINNGLDKDLLRNKKIRINSLLYMIYWFDRLINNKEEQIKIKKNLTKYLERTKANINIDYLFNSNDYNLLVNLSNDYIRKEIVPVQTVDLIIEKNNGDSKQVLLSKRERFPTGISLPGGLVEDSDEFNELNIEQKTFAALRVAAEKVLYLEKNDRIYKINKKENNDIYYSVENKKGNKIIIINPINIYGYSIKENLKSVIRPSDPRHLVDTVGFKCEIIDEQRKEKEYFWESKSNLLNNNLDYSNDKFAFNHHKEIIFHILSKTSVENEMNFNEIKFIKDIINNPLDSYINFKNRFKENKFNTNTSFPELFPTVNKILEEFLMHDINHSYRMMSEDEKYLKEKEISKEDFISEQNIFINNYLTSIKISDNDNEKTKEIKKIKKIILFEICHEDAKPLLAETVLNALLRKEGGETKFEIPVIDEKTNYLDITDVLDTEISTLSYVRNKLQCGFYDKIDKQNTQIVNPKYRKSDFIAEASFEMIYELSIILNKKVEVDYEYILKRVCSVGPNNIYESIVEDENVKKYSDGASYLNPKRYKSNQKLL